MEYECPNTIKDPKVRLIESVHMGRSGRNLEKSVGFCTEGESFDLDNKIANDKVFKEIYYSALQLKVQEVIDTTKQTINEMAMGNAKDLNAASKVIKNESPKPSTEETRESHHQRLRKFSEQYAPLLEELTASSLWRVDDTKSLHSTHLLHIVLEDLPSSSLK
ncbi:MAG: hypothetical protein ACI8RD_003395 [Bacillariaceae sp.]|jgi:hypothetical protein